MKLKYAMVVRDKGCRPLLALPPLPWMGENTATWPAADRGGSRGLTAASTTYSGGRPCLRPTSSSSVMLWTWTRGIFAKMTVPNIIHQMMQKFPTWAELPVSVVDPPIFWGIQRDFFRISGIVSNSDVPFIPLYMLHLTRKICAMTYKYLYIRMY